MARSQRVGLSLKPHVDSVITDLARLTGHTKTSLINSILTKMLPSLSTSVEILKGTEKKNKSFHDEIGKTLIGECADTFNANQLKLEGIENHATK